MVDSGGECMVVLAGGSNELHENDPGSFVDAAVCAAVGRWVLRFAYDCVEALERAPWAIQSSDLDGGTSQL